MWITNGGFADLYIVFAKVDGEQFTAFIVERSFPGVSTGKEEHKLGLHGSSTTPLILQDARVPAGNVLGEVGKGHKVAFNVLNYGRFKLAAMCSGGAKLALAEASPLRSGPPAIRSAARQRSVPSATSSPRWLCASTPIEVDAVPHRRPDRRHAAGQPRQ